MVVHVLFIFELNIENIRNIPRLIVIIIAIDETTYLRILIHILLFYLPLINNRFHGGFKI